MGPRREELACEDASAGPGCDPQLGLVRESLLTSEEGQAPDAIATHLPQGAVRVDVVHEQVRSIGPWSDPDDPVGAHAEAPVADPADLLGLEGDLIGGIGNHDEVVAYAVPLGESHIPRVMEQPGLQEKRRRPSKTPV